MLAKSQEIKQNDTISECPICYKTTSGLCIDYHTYLRYQQILGYYPQEKPLVKCIKCNFYACYKCCPKLIFCPQNCNELNQPKTIFNEDAVFKRYAADKAYNYEISILRRRYPLYLAQSIYDQQENPQPELIKPCSKEQVLEALAITISLFDQVFINIDTQQISAPIKLPFQEELIHISYQIELIIQIEQLYTVSDPQMIYNQIKSKFQDDIQQFFQDLIKPFNDIAGDKYFKLDLIHIQNRPIKGMSLAQMGYTDAIIKTLQKYITTEYSTHPITYSDFCIQYDESFKSQQLDNVHFQVDYILNGPINTKYQVQTTTITDSEYEKIILPQVMNGTLDEMCTYNSKVATSQEFKDYFKDCK